MPAAARAQDQISIDDRIVDNQELEAALEEREKRRASKSAVAASYREADDKAKALIAGLDPGGRRHSCRPVPDHPHVRRGTVGEL